MVSTPDRLNIDPKDRELYEKISEGLPLFRDKLRKEQFLFAVAFGFKNRMRIPLKSRDGFFLIKDLKMEDEALINAVALYEADNIEILSDKNSIYKIAEEYAHAGIKLLADEITSVEFGTFWKQFEKEMHQVYESLEINKNVEEQ